MEKLKRKEGIRYIAEIYINAQKYKSPCFEKKFDATAWKSVKLAEKRQFLATGVMPMMRPTLQDVKFKEFALWWLDHRLTTRSTLRTRERYAHLSPMHLAKAINIVSFGAPIKPTPEKLPAPLVPAVEPAAQVAKPAVRSLRLVARV